ncbi:nuclear transport factor 2 family protein [Actinoplanes siamensis]|nr:nuclear transport factor 2 family protein [Actinoplanes siamensis]
MGQDLPVTFDAQRPHQAFDAAELHGDTDALQTLLADDFKSIGEQGYVLDKEQWIGKFAEFSYSALDSSDVEVRCYDHAAIVRCIQRSRSTWQGQQMALTVRVSQTWIEHDEGWQLAGIQFSSLSQT